MADNNIELVQTPEYMAYADNMTKYSNGETPSLEKFLASMSPQERVEFEKKYQVENLEAHENSDQEDKIAEKDKEKTSDELLNRVRSKHSDENRIFFDEEVANILVDMQVISADEMKNATDANQMADLASNADGLSGSKKQEFNLRFAARIAENQELLDIAPPSILAMTHDAMKTMSEKSKDQNTANQAKAKLATISSRMDKLSDDLGADQGFYFADFTNMADVHEGYNLMFDARAKDFDASKDKTKLDQIARNRKKLDNGLNAYDNVWNLKDVQKDNADEVNKRFVDNDKLLAEIELPQDLLTTLESYQFLDTNGKPIEQFDTAADGTKSIKKGSELEQVVSLAKTDVLYRSLGEKNTPTKNNLANDVNLAVVTKLFAIHNSEEIMQGIAENPNKFTDARYLQDFTSNLNNPKQTMAISAGGFQTALDVQVNTVDGLAHRIRQKQGQNSPVIAKMYDRIADIDKLAKHRNDTVAIEKRQARIKQLKQVATKFGISAITAASISMASAYTAAHTSVSGIYVSGAVIGAGVAMTSLQIVRRKQQAKKNGQKYGWKEFFNDKALLGTVVTTSLGAGALAAAASGNPGLAAGLGYGAMAVGTAMGAVTSYEQAKADGLSTGESLLWGMANGGAVIGGALAGRYAAQSYMDGNRNFQTSETTKHTKTEDAKYDPNNPEHKSGEFDTSDGKHIVREVETRIVHSTESIQNSENVIRNNWYAGAEGEAKLHQLQEAMANYNSQHGTNIPTERFLQVGHEVTNVPTPHTSELASTHVGNPLDGVVHDSGNTHNNLRTLVDMPEINKHIPEFTAEHRSAYAEALKTGEISPKAAEAFNMLNDHFSDKGHWHDVAINGTDRIHSDTWGAHNVNLDTESNVASVDPKGNFSSSYGNHDGVTHIEGTVKDTITWETTQHHQAPDVPGIFGWAPPKPLQKLAKRIGSLTDRIMGKKKNESDIMPPQTPEKPIETVIPIVPVKPIETVEPKDPNSWNLAGLQGDSVYYGPTSGDVAYNEIKGLEDKENTAQKQEAKLSDKKPYGLTDEDKASKEYSEALSKALNGDAKAIDTFRQKQEAEAQRKEEMREHIQSRKAELKANKHQYKDKMDGSVVADRFAEEDIRGVEMTENTPAEYKRVEKQREVDKKEFKETGKIARFMNMFEKEK